ncbi:hypothetical protein J4232_02145 [Candidatus Woesearchaeota archaeon]|nr:hypothetical protein [Candidatus Woesearchaeota archaeon]
METQKNLPVKKLRAGAISVTIWENNSTKDGINSVYNTISLERVYKDKNNTWQATNSFRVQDLPKAALIIEKAYEYLVLNDRAQEAM